MAKEQPKERILNAFIHCWSHPNIMLDVEAIAFAAHFSRSTVQRLLTELMHEGEVRCTDAPATPA